VSDVIDHAQFEQVTAAYLAQLTSQGQDVVIALDGIKHCAARSSKKTPSVCIFWLPICLVKGLS
jgi:hypothetical protein